MTIAVDVDQLRQHRHAPLAEADVVERCSSLDPPDTGLGDRVSHEWGSVLDRPLLCEGGAR